MKRGFHRGGERRAAADIRILSEDALKEIHLGTLEVLERTGIWVEQDEALDIYADGGCHVDRERHIVCIPPQLVEEALAATPPTVTLWAERDPSNDVVLGGTRVAFTNFAVGLMMNDLESGERRPTVLTDCADIARVMDASPAFDWMAVPMAPSDVAPAMLGPRAYATCVANTTKKVIAVYETVFELETIVKIATVLAGGEDAFARRPSVQVNAVSVSPLRLPRKPTEILIWGARHGLIGKSVPMPMAGATAPPSIAAALVVQNAEELSLLVLQHLVHRGLPFIFGTSGTAMDLQWGTSPVGSPEAALVYAGTAAMAKYYDIPNQSGGL
jgi:trimethylamine---corrinoid protein Co-methyltransferase